MKIIEIIIKIALIILLSLCLMKMPYGYFQLVRFAVPVGLLILTFGLDKKTVVIQILFVGLAILFQPLIKISLGREIWNAVDIIVGVFLFVLVF